MNATEEAARRLRSDIVGGALAPGERLVEARLSQRYGVSRVPVREALRVLASEGLVVVEAYRGARVASLSADEAEDLFEVRETVERTSARRAAQRAGQDALIELEVIVAHGRAALADERLDVLPELNDRFHLAVARASGNPALVALQQQLSGTVRWLYASDVRVRAAESWAEHAGIVDAVRSRDAERAATLTGDHVRASRRSVSRLS
ncbi:GntR family transcriptional regulator [Actinomycetospora sp. NBRC 106378]|uniref:GntR family transcriptional regulator n=1 Tax=Actinomycetospora sp. NBRC 106378 TaxID=3032208 RepID=UPI0024A32587|nr:GntR family transcriptional regulator [Actinomycetospora sp. NBRC 106378]GLZ54413.1 transcriptional regulator [Actinomycetospora sp. NBRC 106378]